MELNHRLIFGEENRSNAEGEVVRCKCIDKT